MRQFEDWNARVQVFKLQNLECNVFIYSHLEVSFGPQKVKYIYIVHNIQYTIYVHFLVHNADKFSVIKIKLNNKTSLLNLFLNQTSSREEKKTSFQIKKIVYLNFPLLKYQNATTAFDSLSICFDAYLNTKESFHEIFCCACINPEGSNQVAHCFFSPLWGVM